MLPLVFPRIFRGFWGDIQLFRTKRFSGTFPKKLWQIFRVDQLFEIDIYQFFSDSKVLFTPG